MMHRKDLRTFTRKAEKVLRLKKLIDMQIMLIKVVVEVAFSAELDIAVSTGSRVERAVAMLSRVRTYSLKTVNVS